MSQTKIPGIKAQHAIISDDCRNFHGDAGAFTEAMARLKKDYDTCVKGWNSQGVKGVKYHLALIVERPGRDQEGEES